MADIISTLADIQRGEAISDINAKFEECLQAVLSANNGKGEVIIKLTIKPTKWALGGTVIQVDIDEECKIKKPELEIGASTFFVTDAGTLSRNAPGQDSLAYDLAAEEKERKNG